MKTCALSFAFLLLASQALSAADHMPIRPGGSWLFLYRNITGGWGASTIDSGTVQWDVVRITTIMMSPAPFSALFRQTRNLQRRIHTPIPIDGGMGYDSTFNPPRTTVDSFAIEWINPGNCVYFYHDSCCSFVKDPLAASSSDGIIIRDTAVAFKGKTLDAKVIDPFSCRNGASCSTRPYYVTADAIGPVGYHTESSPCMMDYYYAQDWRLIDTGAATAGVRGKNSIDVRPHFANGFARAFRGQGKIVVEAFLKTPGEVTVTLYSLSGALLGCAKTKINVVGNSRIEVPDEALSAHPPAGVVVCVVEMPDKTLCRQALRVLALRR
jgi:hypothetical protein